MRILDAHGVRGGYAGGDVVRGIDVTVESGRCLAILGPNGAGKSTLLRVLAGILPLRAGTIELLGRPLAGWRRREVAKAVGFVPQMVSFTFPLSVREVVEQGRAPHLGAWQPIGQRDAEIVTRAIGRVGLQGRDATPVQNLSGGERQRVLLARALASEPRLLFLDEPASNLDVGHQLSLLETLEGLLRDGVGVVLVVHDWNLALRLADDALILADGGVAAAGPARDVLDPSVLEAVFGVEVELLTATSGSQVIVPVVARPPTP